MLQPAKQDVVYQAIAHHTRREILNLLHSGPKGVTEIAGHFSVSQPAISQQLRVLLDASLVRVKTAGRQRLYRVNAARLRPVYHWVSRGMTDPAGHVWVFKTSQRFEKGN